MITGLASSLSFFCSLFLSLSLSHSLFCLFRFEAATFLTVPSRTASLNPPSPTSSPSRNFTIYFISSIDRLPTRARRYFPFLLLPLLFGDPQKFYSSFFPLVISLPLRPPSSLLTFRFSHIEYYSLMVQKEQEPPGFGTSASTANQGYRGALSIPQALS